MHGVEHGLELGEAALDLVALLGGDRAADLHAQAMDAGFVCHQALFEQEGLEEPLVERWLRMGGVAPAQAFIQPRALL
jgi:hypothetical protein